jgi:alkanesulfonate monooxygenase SsuD/methylene tetrahydromethanopterin reductase-like flavin-dependent oxidoreductase (luciferase family)
VLDKVRGILADPSKIDAFKHSGTFFDCEGPLNIPRVPQGQPVLIQAGASGRGRQFGSRWAEVIFSINSRVERMLEFRQDIHQQMANPELGVITLSTQSNFDFTQFPLDTRLLDIARHSTTPDVIAQKLRLERDITLGEYGAIMAASIRVPQLVGTAQSVAQQLIDWLEQGACDGYVVSPAYLPGTFKEFTESVVPILQRRGYLRTAYEHPTLRGHLGLKSY